MEAHRRDVLRGMEWCGLCYATMRGRECHAGHGGRRGKSKRRELRCMGYLKKKDTAEHAEHSGAADCGGEWLQLFPAFVEFLAVTRWPDGAPRLPGSATLFTDQGAWKICLSDKDQARVAFVSASSPQAAFQAAEKALVADCLDWRGTKGGDQKSRKNRG
jgi:hypothetical protein